MGVLTVATQMALQAFATSAVWHARVSVERVKHCCRRLGSAQNIKIYKLYILLRLAQYNKAKQQYCRPHPTLTVTLCPITLTLCAPVHVTSQNTAQLRPGAGYGLAAFVFRPLGSQYTMDQEVKST